MGKKVKVKQLLQPIHIHYLTFLVAYMVVSGAPNKDPNHAERICDMAMDMVDASREIKDPSGGI